MSENASTNLLLVEDEALIAMSEKIALDKYGYATRIVSSGEKAVETVAATSDIDLVLMDIDLGSGIDGTQAAELILKDRDIPIIFVSSHSERDIVEKTEKITSYGYIVKGSSITVIDASIKMAFKLFFAQRDIKNQKEELETAVKKLHLSNEELMKTDRALRESEERFQMLFNNAPLGYQSLDAEGNFLDVNQQWLDTFGYKREEVIGNWFGDFLSPDYKDIFRKRFPQFKAQGYIHSELEMIHKNGRHVFIAFEGKVGHDLHGNFKQTHCILQDITDRKKTEETLILSEAIFKAIFDNISDAIFTFDPVTLKISSANKATSEIYGYENSELMGMSCLELSAEVEKSIAVAAQIDKGEKANVPCRHHKKKDGSDVYVQLFASKLNVLGQDLSFTVCRDITDRIRMENALSLHREDLLESQRIAHVGSWRLNLATNEVVWTDELYKMFELDPALPPPPYTEHQKLFTAESWKRLSTALAKTSESGIPYELELETTKKDGSKGWMWVYGKTTKNSTGKTTGLMGVAQDITERKRNEEKLSRQNSLLATLLKNLQIGVYMVEAPSGRPLLANEASLNLLGRGIVPEAKASTIAQVYDVYKSDTNEPYPNDELPLVAAMRGESKHVDDVIVVNPDGTRKRLEVFGSPIKDANGRIWASLVSFQDITDRKIAEEKIQSLLFEKELVLKEVHHRIKNYMNTIQSLLSIQSQPLTEPSAIKALEDASGRLQSMGILYDKLYRSADFTELSVKDYLPPLIDEIIINFPNSNMVKIEKRVEDFLLDSKRLQPLGIIINELLTNIMKYAFKGRESGLITVSATNTAGKVVISVQDDGNGMPESVSFDNSTSFGLQLVEALTQQLKGTIRIERGSGTRIVLEFSAGGPQIKPGL